jgi:hypothetical protein
MPYASTPRHTPLDNSSSASTPRIWTADHVPRGRVATNRPVTFNAPQMFRRHTRGTGDGILRGATGGLDGYGSLQSDREIAHALTRRSMLCTASTQVGYMHITPCMPSVAYYLCAYTRLPLSRGSVLCSSGICEYVSVTPSKPMFTKRHFLHTPYAIHSTRLTHN